MPSATEDEVVRNAGGLFSCPHCESDFLGRDDMDLHIQLAHEDDEIAENPGIGAKSMPNNTISADARVPAKTCNLCGKQVQDIETHIKTAHRMKRNFICSQCNQSFKNQVGKNLHMRSCKGQRPNPPTTPSVAPPAKAMTKPVVKPAAAAAVVPSKAARLKKVPPKHPLAPSTPSHATPPAIPRPPPPANDEEEDDDTLVVGVRKSNLILKEPIDVKPNIEELKALTAAANKNKKGSSENASGKREVKAGSQLKRGSLDKSETGAVKKRRVNEASKGKIKEKPTAQNSQESRQSQDPSKESTRDSTEPDDVSLCFNCGEAFDSDVRLRNHKCTRAKDQTKTKKEPCMLCEISFQQLQDHLAAFHQVSGQKMAPLIEWSRSKKNTGTESAAGPPSIRIQNQTERMLRSIAPANEPSSSTRLVKYPCYECDEMADDATAAREHFRVAHGLGQPKSATISSGPSPSQAAKPTAQPTAQPAEKKKFACTKCNYKGSSKTALNIHTLKIHPAKPNRDMGNRTLPSNLSASTVVANNNAAKPQPRLSVGNPSTAPPSAPQVAPQSAHKNDPPSDTTVGGVPPINIKAEKVQQKDKVFSCKKCGFTCQEKQKLLQHFTKEHMIRVNKKKTEHQTPQTPCPKCPFKADSLAGIKAHLQKAHSSVAPAEHKCQLCDHTAGSEQDLTRHMVVTHGVPESMANGSAFTCTACNINLGSKALLQSHMWTIHNVGAGRDLKATSSPGLKLKISSVVGGLK